MAQRESINSEIGRLRSYAGDLGMHNLRIAGDLTENLDSSGLVSIKEAK